MNRMCIRLLRPPGGPLAEPTTNWDDALVRLRLPSVAEVSIPLDDGVADERVKSIPTTLNGRPAARRSFWGVTRSCHGRVCRGKGGLGPTPLTCLAPPCADASTRTAPTPEEFAKVNRILKPQKKRQKRQRRRNGLLTLEAINRLDMTGPPGKERIRHRRPLLCHFACATATACVAVEAFDSRRTRIRRRTIASRKGAEHAKEGKEETAKGRSLMPSLTLHRQLAWQFRFRSWVCSFFALFLCELCSI